MTEDDQQPTTLLQRLTNAGISDAHKLILGGHVRMNGETITDPEHPAPWPTPYVLV